MLSTSLNIPTVLGNDLHACHTTGQRPDNLLAHVSKVIKEYIKRLILKAY